LLDEHLAWGCGGAAREVRYLRCDGNIRTGAEIGGLDAVDGAEPEQRSSAALVMYIVPSRLISIMRRQSSVVASDGAWK
jgi:hypothetical protein